MKYELCTRRVNWHEMRMRENFFFFDNTIKIWFAIAFLDGKEFQGEGRNVDKAYRRLCVKLNFEVPLDKFVIYQTLYDSITSKLPNL